METKQFGTMWLLLVPAMLAIIALFRESRAVYLGIRAYRWPIVEGEVTLSSVEVLSHATVRWRLSYCYTFHGVKYFGSRYRSDQPSVLRHKQASVLSGLLSKGTHVPVRVDPRDPSRSLLLPGIEPATWGSLLVATIAFDFLCAVALFLSL